MNMPMCVGEGAEGEVLGQRLAWLGHPGSLSIHASSCQCSSADCFGLTASHTLRVLETLGENAACSGISHTTSGVRGHPVVGITGPVGATSLKVAPALPELLVLDSENTGRIKALRSS